MSDASTMRPCYVFGPWTDRAPEDPIRAVREAPNPSERAEVWLYTKDDDGAPVSSDVAGWYGCFGAMDDSRRLGGQHLSVNSAKGRLDAMIRSAGHLFAEGLASVRTPTPATPAPAPVTDTPVGDDRAPDRYMASGRETIDEVRDVCRHLALSWLGYRYSESSQSTASGAEKLGDSLFALHCLLTAFIYRSRAGRKGPAEQDHAKTDWYVQMALHALSGHVDEDGARMTAWRNYDDPRAKRPTYQHYDSTGATMPPTTWQELIKLLTPYEQGLLMMPITDRFVYRS